jgi:hypothetical protein
MVADLAIAFFAGAGFYLLARFHYMLIYWLFREIGALIVFCLLLLSAIWEREAVALFVPSLGIALWLMSRTRFAYIAFVDCYQEMIFGAACSLLLFFGVWAIWKYGELAPFVLSVQSLGYLAGLGAAAGLAPRGNIVA